MTVAHDPDLTRWLRDGRGAVRAIGPDEFEIAVDSQLTLWCPQPAEHALHLEFECQVLTANNAMLIMAGARAWQGEPVLAAHREGKYEEYNSGDMELYTAGFNRTGQVSSVLPNAGLANVRRIGGPRFPRFRDVRFDSADEAELRRWHEWDEESLLVSVREHAAGADRFYRYGLRVDPPRITGWLEGEELFSVIDHRPDPLCGGAFGLRCMTPGGMFRVRGLRAESWRRSST